MPGVKWALMPPATAQPIQYTVAIHNVRELNLFGAADYAYWAAHLAGTGLTPQLINGQAEVSIGATDLTWAGVRFNESIVVLSLGAAAAPETPAGAYLLHAFNSRRALAFMERVFFQTPYYPAAIELDGQPPMRFAVDDRAGGQLRAAAVVGDRPARATAEVWEGPIHLPRRRTAPQGRGGYFYARLAGPGSAYPFVAATDTFALTPSADSPVLGWLAEAQFTPLEWRCRPAADHSKSRTFPRPAA